MTQLASNSSFLGCLAGSSKQAGIPWGDIGDFIGELGSAENLERVGAGAKSVGRFMQRPGVKYPLSAGAGIAGAAAENKYLYGDQVPQEFKNINLIMGAAQGMGLASKNYRWPTIASIPMKQMALLATGTGARYVDSQKALSDTNLAASRTQLQAAQANQAAATASAASAHQIGDAMSHMADKPDPQGDQLKENLNAVLGFARKHAVGLGTAAGLGIPAIYLLGKYLENRSQRKPPSLSKPGGSAGSVNRKPSPRVTLKKPGDYRIQYDGAPAETPESKALKLASEYVSVETQAKRRAKTTGRRVSRLAGLASAAGLGSLALGAAAVPPATRHAWETFEHSADTPAATGTEAMNRYTQDGSAALQAQFMGIPSGVIMQNLRNMPSLPAAVKDQFGLPNHYYNFMRGPADARLQLYEENALGQREKQIMTSDASQRMEGIYNGWAHDHYGKGVDYLTTEQQKQTVADVARQFAIDKKTPPGSEKMYWGNGDHDALALADKTDEELKDFTQSATRSYSHKAIAPVVKGRDALLRGGWTLAGAGVGGALGAHIGRWLAARGKKHAARSNGKRVGTLIGGGLGALAGGAAGYFGGPAYINTFDKHGAQVAGMAAQVKQAANLAIQARRYGWIPPKGSPVQVPGAQATVPQAAPAPAPIGQASSGQLKTAICCILVKRGAVTANLADRFKTLRIKRAAGAFTPGKTTPAINKALGMPAASTAEYRDGDHGASEISLNSPFAVKSTAGGGFTAKSQGLTNYYQPHPLSGDIAAMANSAAPALGPMSPLALALGASAGALSRLPDQRTRESTTIRSLPLPPVSPAPASASPGRRLAGAVLGGTPGAVNYAAAKYDPAHPVSGTLHNVGSDISGALRDGAAALGGGVKRLLGR